MQERLTLEQMIIDDSFVNFCFEKNDADILLWETYLENFPDEQETVENARRMVLGLTHMFIEDDRIQSLNELKSVVNKKYLGTSPSPSLKKASISKITYWIAAGFTGILLFAGIFWTNRKMPSEPGLPATVTSGITSRYETGFRETKTVWLPDSSKVILNTKSVLIVDEDFGTHNRNVSLTGEALFDVSHSKGLPFIVTLTQYNIKVWGTVFNVKAYAEDKTMETSLLEGKVEIISNVDNSNFFLAANEKATIPIRKMTVNEESLNQQNKLTEPSITPLTLNSKDQSVIDTSWLQGKLDIYDKTFGEIKTELERMHNVKIRFTDAVVAKYRFSATFEKENIEQILRALQLSYPFNFSINENTITISK